MARQDALLPIPAGPAGPVYQGVSAQLRAMFPKDDEQAQTKKASLLGWTRLALSHARAIDADPRPSHGRALVSAELRATLEHLADATNTGDAFETFLASLRPDPIAADD